MVVISNIHLSPITINAEPLSPEGFAPFGSVFSVDQQIGHVKTISANQGSAVKLLEVAPVTNNSSHAPSGKKAQAHWNIFRCCPPRQLITKKSNSLYTYLAKVFERHPYSTQTFIPMGRDAKQVGFLVICAPNDPTNHDLPDVEHAGAFICTGNQSITYDAATWHTPMVALGEPDYLDFAVLVHESGIAREDCEEVTYEPGFEVCYAM